MMKKITKGLTSANCTIFIALIKMKLEERFELNSFKGGSRVINPMKRRKNFNAPQLSDKFTPPKVVHMDLKIKTCQALA